MVTKQRMDMLKRQASSLATHQKNLETELGALEDKFAKKKKEMADAAANFAQGLSDVNLNRPTLHPTLYEDMVAKVCLFVRLSVCLSVTLSTVAVLGEAPRSL